MFLLPTRPYLPGNVSIKISNIIKTFQPAPAHLSPFVDNEAEGYIPDRQREINTLAGIETAVITHHETESERNKSDSDDSEVEGESDEESEDNHIAVKNKGDADSSSDEEMTEPISKKT